MAGQMREYAARNTMRSFGFDERIINEAIRESLELYGGTVDAWGFIEEDGYNGLLNRCLDKQEQLAQADALSAPREEAVVIDTLPPPVQAPELVNDEEEDGNEDDEDDSTDDEDYSTDDDDEDDEDD